MNAAHIHLIINHVPVLSMAFGFTMLLAGRLRKSNELLASGFFILILTAVSALAVYLTGEPAEHFIEKFPGVSKALIEEHESAADFALAAAGISGAFSVLGFIFLKKTKIVPGWIVTVSLV